MGGGAPTRLKDKARNTPLNRAPSWILFLIEVNVPFDDGGFNERSESELKRASAIGFAPSS